MTTTLTERQDRILRIASELSGWFDASQVSRREFEEILATGDDDAISKARGYTSAGVGQILSNLARKHRYFEQRWAGASWQYRLLDRTTP